MGMAWVNQQAKRDDAEFKGMQAIPRELEASGKHREKREW